MAQLWIGTATLDDGTLEWQVSDGPVGDRWSSTDFTDGAEALAYACVPGNVITFEADFVVPGSPLARTAALVAELEGV